MKLDRNFGTGKYAIIKMRAVHSMNEPERAEVDAMMLRMAELGVLESPSPNDPEEFFVIRLRDKYAREALVAYANHARVDDHEYADDVQRLADRSGPLSPYCKIPD